MIQEEKKKNKELSKKVEKAHRKDELTRKQQECEELARKLDYEKRRRKTVTECQKLRRDAK